MAAIADLYPRILENRATLIKKGAQKTATSVRGAERGSTPCDSHQLKNPARRESTPLGQNPVGCGQQRPQPFRKACLSSGLPDKGQAVRWRADDLGCRVPGIGWDITSLRTGRVLGYPTTRVIITRNHVLFGHHGAMRGTVARSCLTFCRIRGMGRGKNVPREYLPPNREGSIRHAAGSRACAQYLWSWA